MAFNCCSNCLPLLLEYHSASLDLERKLQMQKIELSKLQFEKQIRDLASLSISQVTAPETPNSKVNFHSASEASISQSQTLKNDENFHSPITGPLFRERDEYKLKTETFFKDMPDSKLEQDKTLKEKIDFKLDLVPDKEISLKNSLSELRSSLNSLISSAEFFTNSVNSMKKSSDWMYSESNKIKDDSLFTFQEGGNNVYFEAERDLQDSKKSSLMSPLRESDLKNSKEGSSGILLKSIEKPPGTPLSDILDSSNKPSSSFNRAFLTLDELQHSSGRKKLFDIPDDL